MMMIPAIDIIDGDVVRLFQGDYQQQRHYSQSPIDLLKNYVQQGAKCIHIVDLSGAKDPVNRQIPLLKALTTHIPIPIQIGGGIRSEHDIESLFKIGVSRVVISSMAICQPQLVKQWMLRYGAEKFVLALDVRLTEVGDYCIAINGWQENSTQTIQTVIEDYLNANLQYVLCTDISKDGTLAGPNIELYHQLCQYYPMIEFQASGGIGCLNDLLNLKTSGVEHVIIGRALLEGKFTLKEAITCWQNV